MSVQLELATVVLQRCRQHQGTEVSVLVESTANLDGRIALAFRLFSQRCKQLSLIHARTQAWMEWVAGALRSTRTPPVFVTFVNGCCLHPDCPLALLLSCVEDACKEGALKGG